MVRKGYTTQILIVLTLILSFLLKGASPELRKGFLSSEKRLIKMLLKNYKETGVIGRPVTNTSETVRVDFGISLVQIMELSEVSQVFTTNVWNRMTWRDKLLRWNPLEYENITLVEIPSDQIWSPDIVLYNYADERLSELRESLVSVTYTGEIRWTPQAVYKSSCLIDVTYFPFDTQTCTMKFGSWTYDGFKVDINFYDGKKEIDLERYVSSNAWEIMENHGKIHIKKYTCCPEPFPSLIFMLKVKRVAAFYNMILLLPCVLLSVLTLVTYWIPPWSPAKNMLGISVFVAFFVLLLLLSKSTPRAATIPVIGKYFCINMIMITLSTFLATAVAHMYMHGGQNGNVPRWFKTLLLDGFACLLCMRYELGLTTPEKKKEVPPSFSLVNDEEKPNKPSVVKMCLLSCDCSTAEGKTRKANKHLMCDVNKMANHHTPDWGSPYLCPKTTFQNRVEQILEKEVRDIKKLVLKIATRRDKESKKESVLTEWRKCALVMDRIFFTAYLTTIVTSLSVIFPQMLCFGPCWN